MENLNVRRNFLKGVSLLGVAAGGFLAAQNSFANTPPPTPIGSSPVGERDIGPVEDIAHLAPLGRVNIHLQANNEPPPEPVTGSGYVMFPITQSSENDNKVTMSVGKDNRLWIKVNDQWRRVALEG
jgi:hypothetical protein